MSVESPYIGVTGFTTKDQIDFCIDSLPAQTNRLLMVGVVATWKSLRNIPMKPKWQEQTPDSSKIDNLFIKDAKVLNLVHYSSERDRESFFLRDLLALHDIAGLNLHGFQINMPWPEIRLMDEYRMAKGFNPRIVLQIGRQAMEEAGSTPEGVVEMLDYYRGTINDILIDPSGGNGRPFNPEQARVFLSAIAERGWNLGIGVAGGLGPDSLDLVQPLIKEFPNLNIDAQSRLRNKDNDLDPQAVKAYLNKASHLFI